MPHFGDPKAPIHHHVAPRYLEKSGAEVGLPNVVTSILASYRGYDTLGETFVIFTAAAGVLAILGRVRRPKRRDERAQTTEDTRA
jgi:multicomponent Na+:H+ antiporter subunit B